MADNDQSPTPPTTGGTPTSGSDYRFGPNDGVPAYFIGRTAREVAQIAGAYYQKDLTGAGQFRQDWGTSKPQVPQITDDDFLQNPVKSMQAFGERFYADKVVPELAARDRVLAQQAIAFAERNYSDDFSRWGGEIRAQLDALQPTQLSPENVALVVQMVRGKHADEIATQRAEALAEAKLKKLMEDGSIVRSGSEGAAPSQTASKWLDLEDNAVGASMIKIGNVEKPFSEWCSDYRLTPEAVDRLLDTAYIGPKQHTDIEARRKWFISRFKSGKAVSEGAAA